jgi:hypothetical protein
MGRFLLLLVAVFVVGVAIVVGYRLSTDAMALVVGVACGVLASIPTSLLIVWAVTRRTNQPVEQGLPRHYPPVVVVNPGYQQPAAHHNAMPMLAPAAPYDAGVGMTARGSRLFRVLGDEETADASAYTWR